MWADAPSSSSSSPPPPPSSLTLNDGTPAWVFDSVRGQFYLRSSSGGFPTLNLASAAVKREIEDLFDYWLTKGIDGFSLKGLERLVDFEDAVGDDAEGVKGFKPALR